MILYFSGTGNSRYLAVLLAKALHDTITDVTLCLKEQSYPTFTSETPYVLVAPVYAWRLPRVLEAWLRQCRFEGSREMYFVLNCGSSSGGD